MYYSDSREFCIPVVHISYLEVANFIFNFIPNQCLTCRAECTYCLIYFCAAFSRVLRNLDHKRKLRYSSAFTL